MQKLADVHVSAQDSPRFEACVALYSVLSTYLPGGSFKSYVEYTTEDMLDEREIKCWRLLRHLL